MTPPGPPGAGLADAGGWMESSSESSTSGDARTLSLTLRVPEENYQSFRRRQVRPAAW